jgi:hypothetical protein
VSLYFCCTERRRDAVRAPGSGLNGIDFLEVQDDATQPLADRQRTLLVHFLKPLAAGSLTIANVRIEGGDSIRDVSVLRVRINAGHGTNVLVVEVNKPGDFSTYTLRLVATGQERQPPPGFDRPLSAVDFSFKVNCPSEFDCQQEQVCPPEALVEPAIDYQAKDYSSFRTLLLDRLSVLVPDWTERNPADVGVALVEVLAYVGDYLSYQQDAVATEAYLGTARRRVSVRRHARLVDYLMHDGCNARTWVQFEVKSDNVRVPIGLQLLTSGAEPEERPVLSDGLLAAAPGPLSGPRSAAPQVFETMESVLLFAVRGEIQFHTWGEESCCLPKGATRAALRDPGNGLANLLPGDVLILEELRGPETGRPEDADRTHRQAVRLIDVEHLSDPLERDPADTSRALPIVEVTWHAEDALTFPLCVGNMADPDDPNRQVSISVARGNVVLADYGRTLPEAESLGSVPSPTLVRAAVGAGDRCAPADDDALTNVVPPRFTPRLQEGPLTQATPYDPVLINLPLDAALADLNAGRVPAAARRAFEQRNVRPSLFEVTTVQASQVWTITAVSPTGRTGYVARRTPPPHADRVLVYAPPSATAALQTDPRRAVPAISLTSTRPEDPTSTPRTWHAQLDLLSSARKALDFVVEVEADGSASLRFGDGHFGERPDDGTAFEASYRVGNGSVGNVGAEAIERALSNDSALANARVRNPLPAQGGTDLESAEAARQYAPVAFRTQERAVTADDYAQMAERHPEVQRAAATFRWTGSWHTVFVTVDRRGGLDVDDDFKARLRDNLEPFRMAGHDVEVDGPIFVPLVLALTVCVKPDYFNASVKQALLEVLSNRLLPDGRRGLFHPDNLTFGQTVFLSRVYAAVQAVDGVASVEVDTFERQGLTTNTGLQTGKLTFERLEIARLDNDPDFPDRGQLKLDVRGGK